MRVASKEFKNAKGLDFYQIESREYGLHDPMRPVIMYERKR